MLFRETVAVYCENHAEHTDTVRTSQETHYVSATEPKGLMLFGKTVAVYCENHTEHTDTVRSSQETLSLRYRAQGVNAVCENSRCLLWESYATYRYCVGRKQSMLNQVVHSATTVLKGCALIPYDRKLTNVQFITVQKKFLGLSPWANYIDQATAACRQS
jgi:hypothetical protein